jgi:dihydrofolate reductase
VIRQGLDTGIVDELHIIVAPVILGGGKRLFADFTKSLDLENRASPVPVGDLHRVRGEALAQPASTIALEGPIERDASRIESAATPLRFEGPP